MDRSMTPANRAEESDALDTLKIITPMMAPIDAVATSGCFKSLKRLR